MAEAYTRQSSFSNGDVIDAPLFNAEFDQLQEAFNETEGHNHDGTAGAGAPVPFIQKGTTGVYVDTSVPLDPKILIKVNGVVITQFTGSTVANTTQIRHTPDGGVDQPLNTYLDSLEVAVGDAASDAAAASTSAAAAEEAALRAEAAAMTLGVPVILADGATYNILETTVQVDIVCLGDATINFPLNLTQGYRYSIRVSSIASAEKRCVLMNPSFNIIGDLLTLTAGNNLELKPKEIVIIDVLNSTDMEII